MKLINQFAYFIFSSAMAIALVGCSAKDSDLHSTQEREMTLGTVQKEIKPGMSQASVAEALGSPNIVTKDDDDKETWIYDKIASEASYSSGGYGGTLILFWGGKSSSKSSTSQKTLTVVIKFDKKSKVEKVTYHTSKF